MKTNIITIAAMFLLTAIDPHPVVAQSDADQDILLRMQAQDEWTALAQEVPKPNLLRIVCNEITAIGSTVGYTLIIQQLSAEVADGSDVLLDGQVKSPEQNYSLTIYEGPIDVAGDMRILSDAVIHSAPIFRETVIGSGYFLGSNYAFRLNGVDRIRFVLPLYLLDGGSYEFNSRTTTNSYDCAPPFVLPVAEVD